MEKASIAFFEKTGLGFDLDITIDKNIPSQAGLGGGSADAAAVLRIFSGFYDGMVDEKSMMECALKVGSDVPFLYSQYNASFASGRGEVLVPSRRAKYREAVIILPENKKINTGEAYRKIDELSFSENRILPSSLKGTLKRNDFPNDFEKVEDYGRLPQIISEISEGEYYSLSGSGSAWFILATTSNEASMFKTRAEEKGLKSVVVSLL